MDIVKGSLEDISRPATAPRSRPASQISCMEVLTPESSISQWELFMDSDEEELTSPDSTPREKTQERSPGITSKRPRETIKESVEWTNTTGKSEMNGEIQNKPHEIPASGNEERPQTHKEDSTDPTQSAEEKLDPKLEKAIKRMKALDELLRKKIAKEKEVKAQTLLMRKQLWEELQLVTQSSACSHEEVVNTITFLALTPQLDDVQEDTATFEKSFLPLFSTQLPTDDIDADPEASQDADRDTESSDFQSNRSHERVKQKKNKAHKKGVNFIQRNIELAKDAGSHVLLMDDEKLRLEQLLGDIQDGWSDDDVTADLPLCLVPGEGYTPEPGELEELAKIDAELQMFSNDKDSTVFNDGDSGIIPRSTEKRDVLTDSLGNPEKAPGEKVLRYTRELREQKLRLKEIDQQLQDIERSSTTPSSVCRYSSGLLQSSVHFS